MKDASSIHLFELENQQKTKYLTCYTIFINYFIFIYLHYQYLYNKENNNKQKKK